MSDFGTIPVAPCSFSAAVLAGGRSTRMGADKSFLQVGGERLIERQIRCLRTAGAQEVVISGRRGVDYAHLGVKVVYDQKEESGPLAGVAAVLAACSCSVMLVLAVDMPAMPPAMLRKIFDQCSGSVGCVPVDDHGLQPLAAAYPKTAHALAEECLNQGELAVQGFAQRAVAGGLVRLLRIEPAEMIYFANWNRPSDWTPGAAR